MVDKVIAVPAPAAGQAGYVPAARADLQGFDLVPMEGGGGGGGGGDGVSLSFASRDDAIAATIPAGVVLLSVLHSGQVLQYRRYTEGGPAETYAPLKTNSNTVFWSPAADYTPLHWGAMGDGITNDRIAMQDMMRFLFGTPATNGDMGAAFDQQRPFVVTGHNRTFCLAAPLIWGNIGTAVDTGMVYNFRLKDIRLRAVPGDWDSEMVTNVPKAMIIAGWNFGNDYSDKYSGIYDVMLDHVTFDMAFLTGARWICNTYQWVENQCRYQHPGIDKVICDTSVRTANQGTRPFGFNTGNGAHTLIGPNFEGLVGESGLSYPAGRDITTMGTIAFRVYTNDFRVDAPIISGVSRAMHILGSAGQIYNLHPWSREIVVGPLANNVMFCNGYLDYTKFILESFGHMFVGMHWILPTGTGADRGVELRASVAGTTGEGLLFSGCTFGGESLDVRYTTTGAGSWVGDKNRKVSFIGCKYAAGHTIAQIERFEDKRGFTVASGAHWFRTGDATIGETRLVGDTLYVGKDRTVTGGASVQLQSQAGDQPTFGIYSYVAGGGGLLNTFAGGFIEIGTVNTAGAIFIHGTTGVVNIKEAMTIQNSDAAANAISAANGDIRAVTGGLSTANKQIIALTDTLPGCRFTGATGVIHNSAGAPTTSACLNLCRIEAGSLLRGGINGASSSGAGVYIAAGGTMSYVTSSDERLKQDFQPIDPALIDMFGVYDFEFIADPGTRWQGVKAQELLAAGSPSLSTAVTGSGIVDKPEDWDTLHPDMPWEPKHYGVDYSKLVPLLISAVKELRARVAELEGK